MKEIQDSKKKNKKRGKTSSPYRWALTIFILAIALSAVLSLASQALLDSADILFALLILSLFIGIGIIFDVIGVAVTAADAKPFHSMAAHKEKGAKEALVLIRNASHVSSVCNDVVGDICGIVSGTTAAVIVLQLQNLLNSRNVLISVLFTALISGLTIGGKALGKTFLVNNVSQTGGHLASNLGVVELTVALHRVFDTSKDRLVFDVGHQCYVHKALTGRQELFSTLRQFGGLSGFPKPYESEHDAFIAGHASNSVSVALGMARARTLQNKDYSVLALIGDGALTGGLAYEGLNNAGASGEPLIVLLNDNGMSINPNVGSMPTHLSHLRSKPAYYHFKKWYRGLFGKNPMENPIYRFNHQVKTFAKKTLWPGSTLFEDMGFTYLGPVDGHDLDRLCNVLRWAKELHGPVVVHINTQKGRGYSFAEENPGKFHGVSPFVVETGLPKKPSGPSFSSVFGDALTEYARQDSRICAITAAMADGTGLSKFAAAYPDRFFDVAIAEGHGVSMAAGMASQGEIPVFAVYSTFLQRGYDQLIHDVSLEKLHVVLGVDRAGLVGSDGETHHGCFDTLFLSEIPGFTVLCPSNFTELRKMLHTALFELDGPVAIRYPRGGEGAYKEDSGTAPIVRLRKGSDVTLLAYGMMINHALESADMLEAEGISAEVLKLNCIAPLSDEILSPYFGNTDTLLVVEDSFGAGCVGQRIAAILAEHGHCPKHLILKNLGRTYAPEGSIPQLEAHFGLDAHGIVKSVLEEKKHE